MRRISVCYLLLLAWFGGSHMALGQGYPGSGPGGRSGMSEPGGGGLPDRSVDKPDAAAKKAFKAGLKALNRALELEDLATKTTDPDKKAAAVEKSGDQYNKALDEFTVVISNQGDRVEAWNYASYIHLRLGAFNEAIDDYNHTLALKPDLLEAIEHRAEAYMAVDRLDDAKAAYLDLFNHARPLADQLIAVMQKWLDSHRAATNGISTTTIDAFGQWVQERDRIARQTPANP